MRVLGVSLAACGLLLAACGKSSSTATGSGGSSSTVGVASVSNLGQVLTGPGGKTLYHYTPDSGSTIKCTGNCAGQWPPFVAPGGKAPATPSGVTGAFGTLDRPDGSVQVTFHGMTLYTFSGDTGPGTANGEGLGGVWYAVGPSGQLVKASGAKGYGY
jgi:predicted lipoprotein with Yx(FWY)xxD motif